MHPQQQQQRGTGPRPQGTHQQPHPCLRRPPLLVWVPLVVPCPHPVLVSVQHQQHGCLCGLYPTDDPRPEVQPPGTSLPVGCVKHPRGSLCEGLFGLQQACRQEGTVLCLHATTKWLRSTQAAGVVRSTTCHWRRQWHMQQLPSTHQAQRACSPHHQMHQPAAASLPVFLTPSCGQLHQHTHPQPNPTPHTLSTTRLSAPQTTNRPPAA